MKEVVIALSRVKNIVGAVSTSKSKINGLSRYLNCSPLSFSFRVRTSVPFCLDQS